ncbi:MAG: hypothetical protein PHF86_01485 [Candidatus Nanoarchaeia archaeon]|jgi:hypothetical protein|nr:hypothetical protein [Candidatus Nanoarchaeia archaeon]
MKKEVLVTSKVKIRKNPPRLIWTGPIKDCTCSSIDIERRECQGYKTCKCGKTKLR